MNDKFEYIPNDEKQNYPFCTLKLLFEKFVTACLNKPLRFAKYPMPANKITWF